MYSKESLTLAIAPGPYFRGILGEHRLGGVPLSRRCPGDIGPGDIGPGDVPAIAREEAMSSASSAAAIGDQGRSATDRSTQASKADPEGFLRVYPQL
ncbi:MAG: hypothetical protein VKK80_08960 [Prochlorothrix sp.]|nr:hypothetical protein [Prochlorothrix sp.]